MAKICFESFRNEDEQMMFGRPNEGRYAMKSKERLDTDTRGMLMGGNRRMEKACCHGEKRQIVTIIET
jgi:hypothetical protein